MSSKSVTEEQKDGSTSQRAGSSRNAKDVEKGSNRRGTSSTQTALCILIISLLILTLAGVAYLAYSHFTLMADVEALKENVGEWKSSKNYGQKDVTSIDLHQIHLQVKALHRALKKTNDTFHRKIHAVDATLHDKLRKHMTTMDVKAEERQKTDTIELHEFTSKVIALDIALQEMNDSIQGRIQATNMKLPKYVDSVLVGKTEKVEGKMNATLYKFKTDIDVKVGKLERTIRTNSKYKVEIDARITEAQQIQTDALNAKAEDLRVEDQNYTEALVSKAVESLKELVWQQNGDLARKLDLQQSRTEALSSELKEKERARTAYLNSTIEKLNGKQTDRLDALKAELGEEHTQQAKELNDKLREIEEKQELETNKLNGGLQTLRTAVESHNITLNARIDDAVQNQTSNFIGKFEGLRKTVESQNITLKERIDDAVQNEISQMNEHLDVLRIAMESHNQTVLHKIQALERKHDVLDAKMIEMKEIHMRNLTRTVKQLAEADTKQTISFNQTFAELKRDHTSTLQKIERFVQDSKMQTHTRNLELGLLREADNNHTTELNAIAQDLVSAQLEISRCDVRLEEAMINQTIRFDDRLEEVERNQTKAHDKLTRQVMDVETKLTTALNETKNDLEERDRQLNETIKTVDLTLTTKIMKNKRGIKRYLNEAADNF